MKIMHFLHVLIVGKSDLETALSTLGNQSLG